MQNEYNADVRDEDRPLFRKPLDRQRAWAMAKRRTHEAEIDAPGICNHAFRGTGITEAKLEHAQRMAAHADPKTTRLYDRRGA